MKRKKEVHVAKKSSPIIKGSFTQRQPDGTLIGLEFHGVVDTMIGDIKDVAEVVLEGGRHGNDGNTRVYIFLQ